MMIEMRPIRTDEHDAVERIGWASYPRNYREGSESFRSKMSGNPSGCFAGFSAGYLAGYVISFPYVVGRPYPIDEVYVPEDGADCLYVHDLCVAEWARGSGLGVALAEVVLRKPGLVALTAPMGLEGFWEDFGFGRVFGMDYYGGPATYMLRP
jgi:hypothetical protein